MATVRPPAVAGLFYPERAAELARTVDALLADARPEGPPPKALVAPHAGYVYSGPVAATAYAALRPVADRIERVVLLGPSHRVPFDGIAAPSVDYFRTPLGDVPVDREAIEAIVDLPHVRILDEAHSLEHGLEVHLPFLQRVLGDFRVVPLAVGEARPADVAEVLERLWGGDETLIVVSSDLSHYQDYHTARQLDAATSMAIEALEPERIGYEQACGRNPLQGLLVAARRHGLTARTLDLRNSGDTAGPKDRVVGYGAYAFH